MVPTEIGLFNLMQQRLEWADRRQQLLAHNVANANTPGFTARDTPTFAATMSGMSDLVRTSPLHLQAVANAASAALSRGAGRAPGGNTVSIEAELGKVADTASMQQLAINLDRSYLGMMRTALGRAG